MPDLDELEGLRRFKKRYRLYSAPGVGNCIHRVKTEKRRHRANLSQLEECRPPYYDHVFGFRVRETLMPRMVLLPYCSGKQELADIKSASIAFARKHNVAVRLSVQESFYGPGTVLIEYRRTRRLTEFEKRKILRKKI